MDNQMDMFNNNTETNLRIFFYETSN